MTRKRFLELIAAVADAGDVDGLADKICALLNNPPQAQANAERAFACGARHFDVNKIAEQLAKVYVSKSGMSGSERGEIYCTRRVLASWRGNSRPAC